ncbi:MAG: OsmC family protein [Pseudomonadota bacterium]
MSQSPGLTLTLARQANQGYTITVGSAVLPEITINIAALTPEQKANEHLGGRLLLSAVLACFTNTLAADLTQAGVSFNTITASASIEKEKDSALRTHYSHIELNVTADAPAEQAAAFESVRQGLLGGSLVTYSLEQGIDFTYEIERGGARPFDPKSAAAAPAPPVQTKARLRPRPTAAAGGCW